MLCFIDYIAGLILLVFKLDQLHPIFARLENKNSEELGDLNMIRLSRSIF